MWLKATGDPQTMFYLRCLVFVFLPSVVFIYVEEDWNYLDAVMDWSFKRCLDRIRLILRSIFGLIRQTQGYTRSLNDQFIKVYFSIISLTKIGFGDLVPSTQPPTRLATHVRNKTSCLQYLTNPDPFVRKDGQNVGEGGNMHIKACAGSIWDAKWHFAFGCYRVILNIWMVLGLSFFGSLISILSR